MTMTFIARFFSMLAIALPIAAAAPQAHAGVFEDALKTALENSVRLQQSRLNLSASYQSLPQAYSNKEWNVRLSAGTGATDRKLYGIFEGSAFSADRTVDDSITLSISKNLYDGGTTRIRVDTTKMSIERSELSFQRDVASALVDAIRTYIDLVTARENVRLQEANIAQSREVLRDAESRFNLGAATATDTAQAQAQIAEAESELFSVRSRLADAEDRYRLLMGEPPAVLELPPIPEGLPATSEDMVQLALEGNISLQMSRLSERSERRNLDRLATRYRPTLGFTASATRSGSNPEGSQPRTESDSGNASVRVDLSVPLYIPPSERASAKADIYRHRATKIGLDDEIRRARINAESNFRSFESARRNYDAAAAMLEAEKLRHKEITVTAELGEKTPAEILQAEAGLLRAEIGLLQARGQLINAAYSVLEHTGQLTTATFGISTPAAEPDSSRIGFPVRPLPYPVFVHPDEKKK